jgi:hypothetical protein
VAVAHGERAQDFVPLSDALVNIRYGLARALRARVLMRDQVEALIGFAKAQFYPDRTFATIVKHARKALGLCRVADRLEAWLAHDRPDLKRSDAIAVLKHAARGRRRRESPRSPALRASVHFEVMIDGETEVDARGNRSGERVTCEDVSRHFALVHPERLAVVDAALARLRPDGSLGFAVRSPEQRERALLEASHYIKRAVIAELEERGWLATHLKSIRERKAFAPALAVDHQASEEAVLRAHRSRTGFALDFGEDMPFLGISTSQALMSELRELHAFEAQRETGVSTTA